MKRILPTLLLASVLAAGTASPAAAAGKTGVRKVCATSTYLTVKPGKTFTGTLTRRQTIRVTRFDATGKYAYGFARGHINRKGWVKVSALCH